MKKITSKRLLSLLTLVVMAAVCMPGLPLHAQSEEKEGVGISPTKLTLEANPGETLTGKFTVTNPGTSPIAYRVHEGLQYT